MNDNEQQSLLEFPCQFPIKIMGLNTVDFQSVVIGIFRTHCGDLPEGAITVRESSGGKYLAMTVTIEAQSREQLDDIYRALSAHELVTMAL